MIQADHLEHILFIDIETVSASALWAELSEREQDLWAKKADTLQRYETEPKTAEWMYSDRAAIFAEFGKVVCISAGYLKRTGNRLTLRIQSYCGEDEKAILSQFAQAADTFMSRPIRNLCAHNGKEFDFPYLGRRFLANGLKLPSALQVQGRKPWEVPFLDTMEMWRFGDHRSFVSLDLLSHTLGIESPKGDMSGADVGNVFWQDRDFQRLQAYCEQDVITTVQVLLHFCGQAHLADDQIELVRKAPT